MGEQSEFDVFVIGAGIAGLSSALALAKAGSKILVLESAAEISREGAGIQLGPNAMAALSEIGVAAQIAQAAFHPEKLVICNGESGRSVAQLPLGSWAVQRYGAPFCTIARRMLHHILYEAALANTHIKIELNADVSVVSENGIASHLQCRIGEKNSHKIREVRYECSNRLIIGADGAGSLIRRHIFGGGAARFSGISAYRAIIKQDKIADLAGEDIGLWWAGNGHLVHYPINTQDVNLVLLAKENCAAGQQSGIDERAIKRAAINRVAHWSTPAQRVISASDNWRRWPLFLSPLQRRRVRLPIILVGDAAQPLPPFAAQGAAMALEDAATLGVFWRRAKARDMRDKAALLHEYERLRKSRTRQILRLSAQNRLIYHLPAPLSSIRDIYLGTKSPKNLLARFDWVYSWRPPTLPD